MADGFQPLVEAFDFGFVLGGPNPGPDRINASWGQATDIRPDFLDNPM